MFQINVSQLLKSTIGSTREYDVNGRLKMEEGDKTIDGKVSLMRTDKGIVVKGDMDVSGARNCVRCLSDFESKSVFHIEEEYFPTIDVTSGEPREPGTPDSFTIDEHNILDLTEALRQYSVLDKPIKPLCKEDCAGLCPVCGTNLNLSSCDCPRQDIDPRWAKLQELVLSQTKSSSTEEKGKGK